MHMVLQVSQKKKKLVIFMSKNALKKKKVFFLQVTKPVLSLSFEVTYISL